MRIGDVNQENYAMFMKMFGGKMSGPIDEILDKDDKMTGGNVDQSFEAREARLVAAGLVEEGMLIREGDTSWKKVVPVSAEIKNKILDTVRRQFITNGNGLSGASDGDEIGAILEEYRKSIPPSERLSVSWTLNQIALEEATRLVDYVKANVPGWDYGEPFDRSIFDDYFGGIDIKV